MKVGILGAGRMGFALGSAFFRLGDSVAFGTRTPARIRELCRRNGVAAAAATPRDAALFGDVIVLATTWQRTADCLRQAAPLDGKVLITCVSPTDDEERLLVGHSSSAAEEIAKLAPEARVVEAFNATYAEAIDAAPDPPQQAVLYCSDDADAARSVREIILRFGFEPLDAGPLQNARYLEPLAALMVHLVRVTGYGPLGIRQRWLREADLDR